jgi:hypothetical protein
LLVVTTACRPDFDERESLVKEPRILAVRSEPPEVKPGEDVAYEALVVTPEGARADVAVGWAFCAAPKPLTENGPVNADCLGHSVRPIEGDGVAVSAAIPGDACALFGPETPPGEFRPRDPDETGGFYQPVRVSSLSLSAFAFERISCDLPNAPLDAAVELAQRYVPNRNPHLLPLRATVDGGPASLEDLPAGRDVRFEVGWSADDAEPFIAFEPASQAIVERREALRVSWYATAGQFEADVTGRAAEDLETTVSNAWRSPDEGRRVFLWVVLRDERGGLDWASYVVEVGASTP